MCFFSTAKTFILLTARWVCRVDSTQIAQITVGSHEICTPATADFVPKLQARSADGWELLGHDRAHGAIVYIQTQASKRDFPSCTHTVYLRK